MKSTITILVVLVFAASAYGQAKKSAPPKDYVRVEISDDGASAELLPMPVGMSPNLSYAEIGIKYFGTQRWHAADAQLAYLSCKACR